MRRILMTLALLMLIVPLTAFQGMDDTPLENMWFYALDTETTTLIGYNAAGETVELADGLTPIGQAQRIDAERVLVQLVDADDNLSIGVLTPQALQMIDIPIADLFSLRVIVMELPWVVMYPSSPPNGETIDAHLINVDTAAWDMLTVPLNVGPCCAFNEDGTAMRYIQPMGLGEGGATLYNLLERDLTTGGDIQLYSAVSNESPYRYDSFIPKRDGSAWLERRTDLTDPNNPQNEYRIINSDGTVEPLETFTGDDVFYTYFGDNLVRIQGDCAASCTVQLQPLDGSDTQSYTVSDASDVTVIQQIGEDVLVIAGGMLRRLSPDGESRTLFNARTGQALVNVAIPISPNGAYTFTVELLEESEGPLALQGIYDVGTDEIVYTFPIMDSDEDRELLSMNVQAGWMVLSRVNEPFITTLFNWQTGEPIEIPLGTVGFVEVVDDGRALVNQLDEDDPTDNGIYLLDLATQEQSLLLAGTYEPITGQDLRVTLRSR